MPVSGEWGTDELTLVRKGPEPGDAKANVRRPQAPGPGDILGGRYRLIRQIGVGGMGEVFEARYDGICRTVAIKILLADLWEPGATGAAARFSREAKAAATLSHPHVVEILDVGETADGLPFFVLEYLDGHDLGVILELRKKMPWARAQRLFGQLLEALGHAHAHGVVHRDLKPENCLIVDPGSPTETLKLLDFGIARVLDEPNADKLTRTGTIVGTPQYMSPEQALGQPVGIASDLYSAGVVLFELLTGEVPFGMGTPLQIASQHITLSPPHLRDLDPELELPPQVEFAVEVALRKDPRARHASAEAFAAALEQPPLPRPSTPLASPPVVSESRQMMKLLLGVLVAVPVIVLIVFGFRSWLDHGAADESPAEEVAKVDVEASARPPDSVRAAQLGSGLSSDLPTPAVIEESETEVEGPEPNAPEPNAPEPNAPEPELPDAESEVETRRPARQASPLESPLESGVEAPAAEADTPKPEVDAPEDPPDEAKRPPRVTPASLPQHVSDATIRKKLRRKLSKCDQAGAARVRISIEIQPNGGSDEIRVLPPYAHSPVAACILRALQRVKFGRARLATRFQGRIEVGRSDAAEAGAKP